LAGDTSEVDLSSVQLDEEQDIPVLLGHLGSAGQHDVHAPAPDETEACSEMAHQPLAFEAARDASLHFGAGCFVVHLAFHGSPRLGVTAWVPTARFAGRRHFVSSGRFVASLCVSICAEDGV
jgi:hypothetical protein